MKIKFLTLVTGLLMAAFTITSCLDDNYDNTVDYSSDASITAFSIEDIETKYTVEVDGKDTTLTTTVTGSDYPFVIDQLKRQIYNVDSLPVGTDVSKVVPSISADGPYIFIEDQTSTESKDSLWTEGDSLSFEKPIFFKVMAYDMSYGDKYEVKVNVHQVVPDSLMWSDLRANNNFAGSQIKEQKAVCFNGRIYVFAQQATQTQVTSTNLTDGHTWTALQDLNIPEKADYSSVMVWGEKLYIIAGKSLYSSTDGANWNKMDGGVEITRLIANIHSDNKAENNRLIGVDNEGYLMESADGMQWERNELMPDNFPKTDLSYASYPLTTDPGIDRMIVLGENGIAQDTACIAWSRLSTEETWGDYAITENESRFCPKLEHIAMIHYNDRLYAFGGDGKKNGKEIEAFSRFYESLDNGVTWTPITKNVAFPAEFTSLYAQAGGNFSFTVDSNDYLWIMWSNGGGVWRGRINRLAFDK